MIEVIRSYKRGKEGTSSEVARKGEERVPTCYEVPK